MIEDTLIPLIDVADMHIRIVFASMRSAARVAMNTAAHLPECGAQNNHY